MLHLHLYDLQFINFEIFKLWKFAFLCFWISRRQESSFAFEDVDKWFNRLTEEIIHLGAQIHGPLGDSSFRLGEWCGGAWCGVFNVVWYEVVWCSVPCVVWCIGYGVLWCGVVLYDAISYDVMRSDMILLKLYYLSTCVFLF